MTDHVPANKLSKALVPTVLALALLSGIALAAGSGKDKPKDAAVLERIKPVAHVEFAKPASNKQASAGGAALVKHVCSACHGTGVAGAPKIGNKADWAPRIAKGLPAMVKFAEHGKGAMPPKGGTTVSVKELTDAIVYMADKSGAHFKAP